MKNFLFILAIIITSISSCCPKKYKYEYVHNNCNQIDYNKGIGLDWFINICIRKAIINTYTKSGEFVNQYVFRDMFINWCDSSLISKNIFFSKPSLFEKPLSTQHNWEVIINDSLHYYITDFELKLHEKKRRFCKCYNCGIVSYKVNGELIKCAIDDRSNEIITISLPPPPKESW